MRKVGGIGIPLFHGGEYADFIFLSQARASLTPMCLRSLIKKSGSTLAKPWFKSSFTRAKGVFNI